MLYYNKLYGIIRMFRGFLNYHITTTSKLPLFIIEKREFVLFP